MLVFLPGSELVYGAYELTHGSVHNGGARLVGALVRCMVMSLGLVIGWQFFGQNLAVGRVPSDFIAIGPLGSLPPSAQCPGIVEATPPPALSWEAVFFGWNVLIILFAIVGLNVRPRQLWEPMLITYLSTGLMIVPNFLTIGFNCSLIIET